MKPLLAIAVLASVVSGVRGETLKELLDASGVTGGVVVHLGCGDGERTSELRGNDTLLVHGLDADPTAVAEARKRLLDIGAYGPVSVDLFDGKHLPYADNLVNAVIAEDAGEVSTTEIMRVLAPLGVAYVKTGGHWQQTVKPWPNELDEWTHYLHDPSNNAVAVDTEVGPPQGMQWANYPLCDEQWRQPVQTSTARRRLTQAGGNPSVVATPTAVYRADMTGFQAFAANDGRELWRAEAVPFGYHTHGRRAAGSIPRRRRNDRPGGIERGPHLGRHVGGRREAVLEL